MKITDPVSCAPQDLLPKALQGLVLNLEHVGCTCISRFPSTYRWVDAASFLVCRDRVPFHTKACRLMLRLVEMNATCRLSRALHSCASGANERLEDGGAGGAAQGDARCVPVRVEREGKTLHKRRTCNRSVKLINAHHSIPFVNSFNSTRSYHLPG